MDEMMLVYVIQEREKLRVMAFILKQVMMSKNNLSILTPGAVSKIFGLPFHITSACFVIDPVIRCHAKINAGSFEANELSRTTSLGRGHFGHFKLMVVWV